MNLQELEHLWHKEKEHYKKSEIGIGVQRFIWDAFQCPDLFNLKKGLKSTRDTDRTNEFTLEESNKGGLADAVIFMDTNVWIPVEVEKLENAQSGEWQILKYRNAFDKKYGILTDGFEWRFYYGDITEKKHYKFTIDEIFSDPARFCTFWHDYIKPKSYYLSFFEEVGQQKLTFFDDRKSVNDHRERFFKNITDVIRKLKDKLLNAGYFQSFDDKYARDKKATEIAYSYLIQFILYKTLVDNAFDDFEDQFKTLSDAIHKNLKKESFNYILVILDGMSQKISENIYKPFHEEQKAIIEEVKDIVHSGEENIMNVAPFLDIFFFIRTYHFADVQNDIFGAIYENYLKELYEEQQLGQYFTDPAVVNFMLEEIGFTASEIKKREHNNISIIDPSCGSGTFLYSAAREIVKAGNYITEEGAKHIEHDILQNVFGLDIAEFPLYLAEMSILMKMLPIIVNHKYNNPIEKKLKLFVTEDSVAEFIDKLGGKTTGSYAAQIQMAFSSQYEGFMRDECDLEEMKNSLKTQVAETDTIPRRRFDFVIGNPPYISYNECSKQKVKIVTMIQDASTGVEMSDIYGWNLNTVPRRPKAYAPKPNLYAFFLALGFALLKENGRFCYIIPQTLLTAGDLDVLRHHLATQYTIEKIYTFAGNLFIGRGTDQKRKISTSSLVLICTKRKASAEHNVECIHLPESDLDIKDVFPALKTQHESLRKKISQRQLQKTIENWNFVKWPPSLLSLYSKYQAQDTFDIYRFPERSQRAFNDTFYFDKGLVFPKDRIIDGNKGDYVLVKNSAAFNVLVKEETVFTKDIRFPKGAQGLDVFDKKYKVIWRYMNPDSFKFSDMKIMVDFNWVLISSNNKREMLYIFALLNSALTWHILSSLLKVQNEKSFLIGIKTIKEFVRIPKITCQNQHLKDKVIDLAEQLLEMEKRTVGKLFECETLLQRFDDVQVKGDELILKNGPSEVRTAIKNGCTKLVENALDAYFGIQKRLPGERFIGLAELRTLPAYNIEEQNVLKKEIDDLVFDLYGLDDNERKQLSKQVS